MLRSAGSSTHCRLLLGSGSPGLSAAASYCSGTRCIGQRPFGRVPAWGRRGDHTGGAPAQGHLPVLSILDVGNKLTKIAHKYTTACARSPPLNTRESKRAQLYSTGDGVPIISKKATKVINSTV